MDSTQQTTWIEIALQGISAAAQAMSLWEVLAVTLGIAYLILAMRESHLCWYAAFGSTAIFSWLFFDVSLIMESALNVYYLAMAVYGWLLWKNKWNKKQDSEPAEKISIHTWSYNTHLYAISGVIILSLISGYLLNNHTTAVMPYLDSFTTWGAVLTTYMVVKKVLENWLYWIVIDTLAIYLYLDRELYLTALLMLIYVILAFIGFKTWSTTYQQNNNDCSKQTASI